MSVKPEGLEKFSQTSLLFIILSEVMFNVHTLTYTCMWLGSDATELDLKFPHTCGCAECFRTFFLLAHIHDNVAVYHEKIHLSFKLKPFHGGRTIN